MDIYIVISKEDTFTGAEYHQQSVESRLTASDIAVRKANDCDLRLEKILYLNSDTKKVTEFELVLVDGKFELKEIGKDDK